MVYEDGIHAGLELLKAGLAWPYYRYLAAGGLARDQRIGLWVDPEVVPPWEWRHAK
jgi:endonuclease YncB( thermonuclease family)